MTDVKLHLVTGTLAAACVRARVNGDDARISRLYSRKKRRSVSNCGLNFANAVLSLDKTSSSMSQICQLIQLLSFFFHIEITFAMLAESKIEFTETPPSPI